MTPDSRAPLVSVLTPSFNQGRFLGDCLTSVANQTYTNVEHIVMDACSTDETLGVLAMGPPKMQWRSEPDRGQSHALNKALAQAGGEIIGWLNADDAYVDARSIERAVEIFRADATVGLVYGHCLLINAENLVLQYFWSPPAAGRLLMTGTRFSQPAVFLRRSALPEPFLREDLQYVMDRDLWVRLKGKTAFRRLDLVVGADRQHGARKTDSEANEREKGSADLGPSNHVWPRPVRKALNGLVRGRGLVEIPRLQSRIQPAFQLRFDPVWRFAYRQALQPRRRMPGAFA